MAVEPPLPAVFAAGVPPPHVAGAPRVASGTSAAVSPPASVAPPRGTPAPDSTAGYTAAPGNKEEDRSDMRGLEGDWQGDQPLERNGPKKDGHGPPCAAGDQRAENDGLFKAAATDGLRMGAAGVLRGHEGRGRRAATGRRLAISGFRGGGAWTTRRGLNFRPARLRVGNAGRRSSRFLTASNGTATRSHWIRFWIRIASEIVSNSYPENENTPCFQGVFSSGGRSRTYDTRIMIPLL